MKEPGSQEWSLSPTPEINHASLQNFNSSLFLPISPAYTFEFSEHLAILGGRDTLAAVSRVPPLMCVLG